MRNFLLVLLALTASSHVHAQEILPHDPASCPDLTGTYRLEKGSIGRVRLVSYTDANGIPMLSIEFGSSSPRPIAVDGITRDFLGIGYKTNVCHDQVIYEFYSHYGEKFAYRIVKWFLDDQRNIILGNFEKGAGTKNRGIREKN